MSATSRDISRSSTVYALVDPRTLRTRYVGITVQGIHRRVNEHLKEAEKSTRSHKQAWLRSLKNAGLQPIVVELIVGDFSWNELCVLEVDTIARLRAQGEPLTNQTDGGDGLAGYAAPRTPEWNARVSAAVKAAAARMTAEQKRAKAQKRLATLLERYGTTSPTQFIDVAKRGAQRRGLKHSPELIKKMGEGQKRRWERIRAEGRYDDVCRNIAVGTKKAMADKAGSSA